MTQPGSGLTYAGITSDTISNSSYWPRVHHTFHIQREKSNLSFTKSLFTSAASFAIASKSGRLCAWIHEVCGLRMFGRPPHFALLSTPIKHPRMGARRSPSLGTVFSQSDSSGKAMTWRARLARLFYKGKLVSDRWVWEWQTPNRRGPKKFSHLNLEAPHPGITKHYPASPCYQSTYSIIAALLTFHYGLV